MAALVYGSSRVDDRLLLMATVRRCATETIIFYLLSHYLHTAIPAPFHLYSDQKADSDSYQIADAVALADAVSQQRGFEVRTATHRIQRPDHNNLYWVPCLITMTAQESALADAYLLFL